MNAKKAKKLRREAKRMTGHLGSDRNYRQGKTVTLGECTRGAYKALKTGDYLLAIE